jgi:hypothetical protein
MEIIYVAQPSRLNGSSLPQTQVAMSSATNICAVKCCPSHPLILYHRIKEMEESLTHNTLSLTIVHTFLVPIEVPHKNTFCL